MPPPTYLTLRFAMFCTFVFLNIILAIRKTFSIPPGLHKITNVPGWVNFWTTFCGLTPAMFPTIHCSNITFHAVDALCLEAHNKMSLISFYYRQESNLGLMYR
jgi:hypothetical protein